MSSSSDAYASFLAQLYGRSNAGIKLGLETVRDALDRLGAPDRSMRHVVVAGTNGKGSTSALIAGALREAGERVGHFSSPHVLRFTERVRINEGELTREAAMALTARVLAVEPALARPLTFFEVTTCLSLLAFAEAGVRVAVLEVGLGGRLDATNAVGDRQAVITPIGIDHTQYLGSTLESIAREKAGIMRQGEVMCAPQEAGAMAALAEEATRRGARLRVVGPATLTAAGELELPAASALGATRLARFPAGAYQRVNIALAAAAFAAQPGASPAAFARAAERFAWPGRFQWLGDEVLVDGAHNEHGLRALLSSIEEEPRSRGRPMHLVFTALGDKPLDPMASLLRARASTVHVVSVGSRRARPLDELAAPFAAARSHAAVADALTAAALEARASGGFVLVTGSLFLAADALHALTGAPRDPPVDG